MTQRRLHRVSCARCGARFMAYTVERLGAKVSEHRCTEILVVNGQLFRNGVACGQEWPGRG